MDFDFIIATRPILNPETQLPIVNEGQWLTPEDCTKLADEYGVDEILGHVVRWPK